MLVYLVFLSTPITFGQSTTQKQADGVDFILVLDQSGSMGGYGKHPSPNDPFNKRNLLIGELLPYLVDSAYLGKIHRLSVVEFGSRFGSLPIWKPELTLKRKLIQAPPTGQSRAAYLQTLQQAIATLLVKRTRGDSDHGAALELALQEIAEMKKNPVPPPQGRTGTDHRLILTFLLTDGQPYVKEQNKPPLSDIQLQNEIQAIIKKFPAQDAVLFAFGLNDADNYWDGGYGSFWDQVASTTVDNNNKRGHAQKLDNHKKILEQVLPLLTEYTNPPGLKIIDGDRYECPPYLKSIQFIIEFPRSYMKVSQVLEIYEPGNIPFSTANAREKQVVAYIDVNYPAAGVWRFTRKNPDIRLMVQETYETVSYVSPMSPISKNHSHGITFKVSGPGPHNSFVQHKQYQLQERIVIDAPNGKQDILNAEQDPNDARFFISQKEYKFDQDKEYRLAFDAVTTGVAGTPVTVLRSAVEKVQVNNSPPIELVMEEPKDQVHSSFADVDQNFRFGLYIDNRKSKVKPGDVLQTGKDIPATLEILDADSNLQVHKIDFPLSQGIDGLTGRVAHKQSWMEMIRILMGNRSVKVTVIVDQKSIKGNYFLTTPATPSRLYEFDLKLEEGMWTYLFLFFAIGTVLLALLIPLLILKMRSCSTDVPKLIYRQESELFSTEGSSKTILVDKNKIKYKHGDLGLVVPDTLEVWKPELTITRKCIDEGVSITLEYEKLGKTPADRKDLITRMLEKLKIKKSTLDDERMRQDHLQKRQPRDVVIHRIPELADSGMIFELKIQGKDD